MITNEEQDSLLRGFADSLPVAVVTTDLKGYITSFNREAQMLFGWAKNMTGIHLYTAWACDACAKCVASAKAGKPWMGECRLQVIDQPNTFLIHKCGPVSDPPGSIHVIVDVLNSGRDTAQKPAKFVGEKSLDRRIVTRNKEMLAALDTIVTWASTPFPVLIEGETGTGKDLFARIVHLNSARASGPYVTVNCANLSGEFLRSELFGHVRGAFTGAVAPKIGLLDVANGGTLFIDEVSDMLLEVQAMLLHVLEKGIFRKMGSNEERKVDVRVIAATNRPLAEQVERGEFRSDLFFRLSVLAAKLPPLRQRKDDIELLVAHFRKLGPTPDKMMTAEARRALQTYDWPGNVRELKSALESAYTLAYQSLLVTCDHLPEQIVASITPKPKKRDSQTIKDMEKSLVIAMLEEHGGNRTQTARVLGISRNTLINKIRKYGLEGP